jgi:hypothetical protein
MDYRVFFIPVLLTATAALMYFLFKDNPDYEGMAEHKKHEFIARINGVMFTIYMLTMRMFGTSYTDTVSIIEQFIAYLVYDAGHMTFYAKSLDFYIHHAILMIAYTFSSHAGDVASRCFDAICILEATNPSFSLGWMMEALKYPNDTLHMGVRAAVFVIWTLVRMVFYPYWIGTVAWSSTPVTLASSAYMVLNVYWFWLLCKKAHRTVTSLSPSPVAESPNPEGATPARSNPRERRT